MIACLFLYLLIAVIPLVDGIQKILPNVRQLDDDVATMIALKHNVRVEAVMGMVSSDAPMTEILDAVLEVMEDEEIPNFDPDALSTIATTVFVPDENGNADFIQGMMDESEALSETSPVMTAVYEVMLDLENVRSVKEFTKKVTEAAEESGEESEMTLKSISDAVAERSGQYWSEANGMRHKLQPMSMVAIVTADVIGALIGFLLGGMLGAILLRILASILTAFQLGLSSLRVGWFGTLKIEETAVQERALA